MGIKGQASPLKDNGSPSLEDNTTDHNQILDALDQYICWVCKERQNWTIETKNEGYKLLYVSGLRNYKKENELKEMKKTSKEDEKLWEP